MNKKINCRHGLNNKEELEARRLKNKLLSGDREAHKIIKDVMRDWLSTRGSISFEEYLKERDKVLYSSWKRFSSKVGITDSTYYIINSL